MQRVSRPDVRSARLVVLLLVVLAVTAAVAAGPATAATPTTLTLAAQKTSVNWGSTAILNGVLQTSESSPQAVDQQQVRVEYATSSLGPWMLADTVTNSAAPYSSGAYTYSWTAARNLYWRMVFQATAEYAGATSNLVRVQVKPVLGKPSCPRSVKAGKRFTVSGSLKPRFPAGSRTVKVKAQRYVNGKWRAFKTYTATNADAGSYSRYSVRIKITTRGKYRFYATTATTSTLAAGKSVSSRTLRVL